MPSPVSNMVEGQQYVRFFYRNHYFSPKRCDAVEFGAQQKIAHRGRKRRGHVRRLVRRHRRRLVGRIRRARRRHGGRRYLGTMPHVDKMPMLTIGSVVCREGVVGMIGSLTGFSTVAADFSSDS